MVVGEDWNFWMNPCETGTYGSQTMYPNNFVLSLIVQRVFKRKYLNFYFFILEILYIHGPHISTLAILWLYI